MVRHTVALTDGFYYWRYAIYIQQKYLGSNKIYVNIGDNYQCEVFECDNFKYSK